MLTNWNYHPYIPANIMHMIDKPTICRLAPGVNEIEFEWFDNYCSTMNHRALCYEVLTEGVTLLVASKPLDSYTYRLTNLKDDCEYLIYISRNEDNQKSLDRRFRTGFIPGVIVNYIHPLDSAFEFSGKYLCSPSIVKLKSGILLASMDVYAPGAPQNLTLLFRSDDNGRTWKYVTDLFPCFWGKLFLHQEILYMLAVSTEYGDLLIGYSIDDGKNWSAPQRIFTGCQSLIRAPMPVISYAGRLWTTIESGNFDSGFKNSILSINENDDLLISENWGYSEFVAYDPNWEGTVKGPCLGCIEGNVVVSPKGDLFNFLRYQISNCIPNYGKALILRGNKENPQEKLEFEQIVEFNSAMSKFDILRDDITGYYITIANKVINIETPNQRNILSVMISKDLIIWEEADILFDYRNMSSEKIGFQYIDFVIADQDLLYLSRTAFNNADSYHDSNCITFHKIDNFRKYFKNFDEVGIENP